MFSFLKRRKQYPPFEHLKAFTGKDQCFRRCAPWMVDEKRIIAVDPHERRLITMDPWPQIIFHSANGIETVEQYIFRVADTYDGPIPEQLDETIINELVILVETYGLIEFTPQRQRPDPLFNEPQDLNQPFKPSSILLFPVLFTPHDLRLDASDRNSDWRCF